MDNIKDVLDLKSLDIEKYLNQLDKESGQVEDITLGQEDDKIHLDDVLLVGPGLDHQTAQFSQALAHHDAAIQHNNGRRRSEARPFTKAARNKNNRINKYEFRCSETTCLQSDETQCQTFIFLPGSKNRKCFLCESCIEFWVDGEWLGDSSISKKYKENLKVRIEQLEKKLYLSDGEARELAKLQGKWKKKYTDRKQYTSTKRNLKSVK